MPKAIYPGSFDPITMGHIDIVKRSLTIFDELIVAVAKDSNKNTLFSFDERIEILKESFDSMNLNVTVKGFSGLLVDFAKKESAKVIIRGLRAVSDFEYEFQMAGMNLRLSPEIETIFMPSSEKNHFIASSFVKEVYRLGGDVRGLVPKVVEENLAKKF